MKSNKSFIKRLKLTKSGKILARKSGINHFNAKKDRQSQLSGKKTTDFKISAKDKSRFLPN